MIVGVFGGLGYFGSRLVTKLEENHTVLIADKMMYKVSEEFLKNKTLFKFDIADESQVKEFIDACDMIVNFAAYVGEDICQKYKAGATKTNFYSAVKISDYCNHSKKKMIFLSTCSNYGSSSDICYEDSLLNPLTLYSRTKVATEKDILKSNPYGIVLRMSTIFGVSDARTRFDIIPNQFVKEAMKENKVSVYMPDAIRPIIHVDDAVQIIMKILESDTKHSVYNCGFNEMNLTKASIVTKVTDQTDAKMELIQSTDNRTYEVDFSRLHSEFDIKQIFTLEKGIAQIIAAIKSDKVDLDCGNY